MKSAWDKIFNCDADAPLTDEEREAALQELAKAVLEVEQLQESPEHERILKLIREKLAQLEDRS